jgi:hypothetical protein
MTSRFKNWQFPQASRPASMKISLLCARALSCACRRLAAQVNACPFVGIVGIVDIVGIGGDVGAIADGPVATGPVEVVVLPLGNGPRHTGADHPGALVGVCVDG